jgi:Flp pilus assembly protein TadG
MKHSPTLSGASLETPTLWQRIRVRLSNNSDGGQSLVEFAVCLPILLLVLTGIMTFGIALNNYLLMTEAVSTSARTLAISAGQTLDPCQTAATAFQSAAPYLKTSSLSYSLSLINNSSGVSKSYSGSSCSSSSTSTGAAGYLVQGMNAQLTVTYPCNLAVYGKNLIPGCKLKVQTSELVQ